MRLPSLFKVRLGCLLGPLRGQARSLRIRRKALWERTCPRRSRHRQDKTQAGFSVLFMGNLFSPEERSGQRSCISHFPSAKTLFLN
jgi:hypothetical protein